MTQERADPAELPRLDLLQADLPQPRRAFVATVMGLPVSVHVRGPQARGERVADAVELALDALRADDAAFSLWKPESAASRVRRGELALEDAGPAMNEVVALCEEASRRTGGAFSCWLPGPDGRSAFDPTGMVKGWAVQRAFDDLLARLDLLGHHDLLVSAGGDVVVACRRTDTPDWVVAVEDPRDTTHTVLAIPLRAGAVATSGTAARGQHVVDPVSQAAASSGLLSATIVGPSLVWADAFATAAFVDGVRCASWLADWPDHVAFLVRGDGSTTVVRAAPDTVAVSSD